MRLYSSSVLEDQYSSQLCGGLSVHNLTAWNLWRSSPSSGSSGSLDSLLSGLESDSRSSRLPVSSPSEGGVEPGGREMSPLSDSELESELWFGLLSSGLPASSLGEDRGEVGWREMSTSALVTSGWGGSL